MEEKKTPCRMLCRLSQQQAAQQQAAQQREAVMTAEFPARHVNTNTTTSHAALGRSSQTMKANQSSGELLLWWGDVVQGTQLQPNSKHEANTDQNKNNDPATWGKA